MSDKPLVKLKIDGRDVQVPAGTLVIEAARQANIAVPHYCYHPALGNPGNCRLCAVEVEGMPKLQVSCRLPAAEGMVVRTSSPNARRAQASSLELHLVNHPLDCPVCDQAGECKLQDYYMEIGLYPSQVKEEKKHKEKRLPIGKHVMLDQERCILCTRCTRFVDKVTGTHELGIFNRGNREVLAPYPGMTLDNPYSANVVDICPVGALTDRDFRFKVRVWYLKTTPSVCTGCSRGCSIDLETNTRLWHTGGERVVRYKPRLNPEVNGYWMCDEGRYGFHFHDRDRLGKFRVKTGQDTWRRLEWSEGLKELAGELKQGLASRGAKGLAVVLSGKLSNEDFYLARRLFIDTLGAETVVFGPGPEQLGEEDKLLRRRDKVPNLRGAQALGFGSAVKDAGWDGLREGIEAGRIWGLYVVDRDPSAIWADKTLELVSKLYLTIYQGSNAGGFASLADWVLPAATHAEEDGTFTNFEGRVQRFHKAAEPLGQSRSDWDIFNELLGEWGARLAASKAEDVFKELAAGEKAFSGLRWDALGTDGLLLKGAKT